MGQPSADTRAATRDGSKIDPLNAHCQLHRWTR
jgi:hypothetical protein